ncbi:hypothetical protein D0T60_06580 [Bacteroides sp. 224]|nr:hypothetical protein [Bacteroides sp. 224]
MKRPLKKQNKHIGVILAIVTLLLIFMSNVLFNTFGVNLSTNEFPYYVNFILIALLIVSYLLFRFFHYKLIPFIISVLILQNLLISAMVDLVRGSEDYDMSNDFSFLIAVPVAFIGTVVWGIIFDYRRNKK